MNHEYKRFRYSPYWRAVRRQALWTCPMCEQCLGTEGLQIHHTGYDFLGTKEEYYRHRNLRVLCRGCHCTEHDLPSPDRPSNGPELLFDVMHRMGFHDCRPTQDVA